MRSGFLLGLCALVPAGVGAQEPERPAGWTWRLDGEQRMVSGQEVASGEWRYVTMAPGWHVTTTDQGASLFAGGKSLSGPWGIEAEIFLFPRPSDAPFGIILEDRDARPAGSRQLRFLMRRDGTAALVARHGGVDTMLVSWVADTAVKAHTGGVDKYLLRVMHENATLAFSVNGRDMLSLPTGGADHASVPGLRIGPGINLHVSRYDLITPLAPPRAR
jgi:hypothetical protein